MTATNDSEVARNFQQNEIARYAFEAAQKSFSDSIIRNPDAALALELQKMEVQTPLPPISDEDSVQVALQLQEQEHFEQERHDADLAQRLTESDDRNNRRQNNRRVDQLSEALQRMERTSPSNGMDFTRSVRGPSMIGQLVQPSNPDLTVFGPANITDHFSDDSDTETDGHQREPSILPRPRPRQQIRPLAGLQRVPANQQQRASTDQPGQIVDIGQNRLQLNLGQAQSRRPQHHLVPNPDRQSDISGLPGQLRQPNRGLFNALRRAQQRQNLRGYQQRQDLLPGQHGLGRQAGMLGMGGHQYNQRDQDIDPDDYEALWELQERNGDVRSRGLTPQQIGRIPHHKYKPKPEASVSGKDCCRICLSEYATGENVKTLPCFHSYHKNCIDKWLKSQAVCPVCRENIRIN